MAHREEEKKGLLIERVFDAPRVSVFEAWIDPALFVQWWGPTGFTVPHCEIDARREANTYIACGRQRARTTGERESIGR